MRSARFVGYGNGSANAERAAVWNKDKHAKNPKCFTLVGHHKVQHFGFTVGSDLVILAGARFVCCIRVCVFVCVVFVRLLRLIFDRNVDDFICTQTDTHTHRQQCLIVAAFCVRVRRAEA